MPRTTVTNPGPQLIRGTKPRVYAYKDFKKIIVVFYRDGVRHFADYMTKSEAEDLSKDLKTALKHPDFSQKEINELMEPGGIYQESATGATKASI